MLSDFHCVSSLVLLPQSSSDSSVVVVIRNVGKSTCKSEVTRWVISVRIGPPRSQFSKVEVLGVPAPRRGVIGGDGWDRVEQSRDCGPRRREGPDLPIAGLRGRNAGLMDY